MKKAFLLGVTLLATFSLTGCEMIEKLLQGGQDVVDEKKQYKYDDFAVLIAGTEFKFTYTKCTAEEVINDVKSTYEYTYNSEDSKWHYQTESGADRTKDLSINICLQELNASCKVLKKSIDNVFKFYASKKGYEITGTYKNDGNQVDAQYTFNTEGLITLSDQTNTDLDTVKAVNQKVTYKYE